MTDSKEILYSVAYLRAVKLTVRGNPIWEIDTSYLHAVDQTEARFKYSAGNSIELMNYTNYRAYKRVIAMPMRQIIAVAPVVFIHEDQETGERNVDLAV